MKKNPFTGLGLIGRYGPNKLSLFIDGDYPVLQKLRSYLTIRNDAIGYKIKKANEAIIFWKMRGGDPYAEGKLEQINNELVKLREDYEQIFFEDTDEGLVIPAGFWYVCDKVENDIHLNTEVKTRHVAGSRDYQIEAVNEAMKYKRSTTVLATGLGKSRVILNMTLSLVKAGKRVFIVVPTEYLVGQILDTIKPHHDSITAVGGKRKHPKLGTDVFVCTAQSTLKYISPYDAVIIDESHHSSATTWLNIFMASEAADYCYNLTATPFRADGMDLAIHAFGGPTVYEKGVRWGIDNGWLSPCKIYLATVRPTDKNGVVMTFPDTAMAASVYKKMTINSDVFSYLETQVKRMLDAGKKVIIVFKTVAPGVAFRKFCKKSIPFDVADSSFKKPLDDFRNGLINILVSNDKLISEGIDIPSADVLFLLTQHSSAVISYQTVGRVLRKSPGKEHAIIVDVFTPGFKQFETAREKRIKVFKDITDEVIVIGEKK
jgi:superfamily II DNA or RNA helicase